MKDKRDNRDGRITKAQAIKLDSEVEELEKREAPAVNAYLYVD